MSNKPQLTFRQLRDKFKQNNYYNHPNDFSEEGVDHININYLSNTNLGKVLDLGYNKIIDYPHIGKFNSVTNLWYWIKSEDLDDVIRRLSSRNLKQYTKEYGTSKNKIPEYKAILGYATWLKIKKSTALIKEIKDLNNDIKFLCYNIISSSGIRICNNQASLVIDIANIIVKSVKEEVEPNFSKLVPGNKQSELYYLDNVLSKVLTEEKIELLKNK